MPRGMLAAPIARGVEQRRRWISRAKRPIVANVGPNPPGVRFSLRQDRDLGIVAMKPIGGERMDFDQFKDGPDCVSAWNKDPVFGVIGIQSGL